MKVAAVIVARKGSKRVPNKWKEVIDNEFGLVERKIRQLLNCPEINEIYIGSDDEQIRPIAATYRINFVKRQNIFCDEVSSTPNDMVRDMLSNVDADLIIWAHPTNPFIDDRIYSVAIKKYNEGKVYGYDSLFCATILKGHYFSNNCQPINFDPQAKKHIVAAALPPLLSCNGGIFIRNKVDMEYDGRFFGSKPQAFVVDRLTGLDIDTYLDLDIAKLIHQNGDRYAVDKMA